MSRSNPDAAPSLCFVCGTRPAVGLYLDPLGWYLIGCSSKFCIAPHGCEAYDYVMSYSDFMACRRMVAHNRTKAMLGEYGSGQGVKYLGAAVESRSP
jgi:hypothetical protein